MSYNLIFNWILPDQLKILIFFIFLNLVRFQLLISRILNQVAALNLKTMI